MIVVVDDKASLGVKISASITILYITKREMKTEKYRLLVFENTLLRRIS
jgi:hypothetical protein